MGISVWQILIVLLIVVLLFGTKKLRNIGGDLGEAVRGFKKSLDVNDEGSSVQSLDHADANAQKSVEADFSDEPATSAKS